MFKKLFQKKNKSKTPEQKVVTEEPSAQEKKIKDILEDISLTQPEKLELLKAEKKKELESLANPKCSKCHGLGQLGWNRTFNYWIMCKCVMKMLNFAKENQKEV
jgi:hypothetical protein